MLVLIVRYPNLQTEKEVSTLSRHQDQKNKKRKLLTLGN